MPLIDPYHVTRAEEREASECATVFLHDAQHNEQGDETPVVAPWRSTPATHLVFAWSVPAMALLGLIIMVNAKSGVGWKAVAPGFFLVLAGMWVSVLGLVAMSRFRRRMKGEPRRFGWDEAGIRWRVYDAEVLWRWPAVRRWCESERLFAYQADSEECFYIPKAALNTQQRDELRSTMRRRIGPEVGGPYVED